MTSPATMPPAAIISAAAASGVTFKMDGDRIQVFGVLPDALRQAIAADRRAFVRHLRGEPPETVDPPPPADTPSAPASHNCTCSRAIRYEGHPIPVECRRCPELQTDPPTIPAPAPVTAGNAPPPEARNVKCNTCRHADNDGHGDPVAGCLLCRAGGTGGWGNAPRHCGRFAGRTAGSEDPEPPLPG